MAIFLNLRSILGIRFWLEIRHSPLVSIWNNCLTRPPYCQYIRSQNNVYWQKIWFTSRRHFETLYIGRPYGLPIYIVSKLRLFLDYRVCRLTRPGIFHYLKCEKYIKKIFWIPFLLLNCIYLIFDCLLA